MKIGIIREGKVPQDRRVPLTPKQCRKLSEAPYNLDICVQPAPFRSYSDSDYELEGVRLTEDLADRDVLLGVKEVPIDLLIPNKTYFFFSHTIKKQPHNRKLLKAILEKNIRLLDYEVLVDDEGNRLIAFGMFAGVVGAYNALWMFGKRSKLFDWPRLKDMHHYKDALPLFESTKFPPIKIVLTGSGRVASGALRVIRDMNIREVSNDEFIGQTQFGEAVFTVVTSQKYAKRKDGSPFEKETFYDHPELFESAFEPFTAAADIFINCIYWDVKAPAFFELSDIQKENFRISLIADITCDIAPESSVPTTLRPSTIENPIYGVDRDSKSVTEPFLSTGIDVMAVDNLPAELPRDASEFFGTQFINVIVPELQDFENSLILDRGTIAKNGQLTEKFSYLSDYVGD